MTIKLKKQISLTVTWLMLLIPLTWCNLTYAEQKPAVKPDDPNEKLLKMYEAVIKDYNDPNELLVAKWNAIVKVLQDKSLEQKSKRLLVNTIMLPVFDFELMSRLSLGKTNWSKLSATEQARFTQLFTELLKNSYHDKIMGYKDQKVLFKSPVKEKNSVNISMVLVSSDSDTALLYKLRKTSNSWKIYDVEIQGVSILLTYRSQFDDILKSGTVKDLLTQIEKIKPQS